MAFAAEGSQLIKKQSSDFDAFGWEFNKSTVSATNYYKYQKQERVEEFGSGGVPLNIDFWKFRPSDPNRNMDGFWRAPNLGSTGQSATVKAISSNISGTLTATNTVIRDADANTTHSLVNSINIWQGGPVVSVTNSTKHYESHKYWLFDKYEHFWNEFLAF